MGPIICRMGRLDTEGHQIKDFRIAEVHWRGGPLFVLWTMDEDGVWVLPGASRARQDMRTIGETIQQTGSFWNPQMAPRIAHLQNEGRVHLIDLDDKDQDAIGAELVAKLRPAGES